MKGFDHQIRWYEGALRDKLRRGILTARRTYLKRTRTLPALPEVSLFILDISHPPPTLMTSHPPRGAPARLTSLATPPPKQYYHSLYPIKLLFFLSHPLCLNSSSSSPQGYPCPSRLCVRRVDYFLVVPTKSHILYLLSYSNDDMSCRWVGWVGFLTHPV